MPAYYCEHEGMYLGGFTVVNAKNKAIAKEMVIAELQNNGLYNENDELELIRIKPNEATIIFNGDY